MTRIIVTGEGYARYDQLIETLGKLNSESPSWSITLNDLQVLDRYIGGETREMTAGKNLPGMVSSFDRLVAEGKYLQRETI